MKYLLPGFSLYRSLRRTNPSPYMFYFDFNDFSIIGSSPEILVKVENDDEVTIRPIAGTRPRGLNESEDKSLENELLNDKKELAEHLMLLDLGRNDIGRVSKIGSVKITESFVIERYSHVMHIVSNVKGKLSKNVNNIRALLSGLPAGTVSGAPKIRAMEIIDELENEKRSIFGGGVGYFGASGQMDFCIAIRTAILKNQDLFLQAGGGVVFDSDAEKEFQETVNKSKALIKAAEDSIHFFGD
jgi:anthranilate synthase component 1